MGVEPTRDSDYCPADGFEDREAHRDPSASREERWQAPLQGLYPPDGAAAMALARLLLLYGG